MGRQPTLSRASLGCLFICTMSASRVFLAALALLGVAVQQDDFVDLSMIELEAHEEAYKPSFSVCKYLLEETKSRLGDAEDRSWPHVAHHIAHVRSTLPEHVQTDCDHFIKHNKEDIMTNFLQIGMETTRDVRLDENAPEPKQKKKIPSVWAMMEEQTLAQAQANQHPKLPPDIGKRRANIAVLASP